MAGEAGGSQGPGSRCAALAVAWWGSHSLPVVRARGRHFDMTSAMPSSSGTVLPAAASALLGPRRVGKFPLAIGYVLASFDACFVMSRRSGPSIRVV